MNLNKLKQLKQLENIQKSPGLYVNNSYCKVVGLPAEILEILKDTLTYDNQEVIFEIQQTKIRIGMAFRYKKFGMASFLKKKLVELENSVSVCWFNNNSFPTGHLSIILEKLEEIKYPCKIIDLRENKAEKCDYWWINPSPKLRYYQKDVLKLAEDLHRGIIESAVGSGKSLMMQHLTYKCRVPTLILVPSVDLGIQTYDSFVHYFGLGRVSLVQKSKDLKKLNPIRICTVHTLNALRRKGELEGFLARVGMVCVDEVHHAGAKSYTELLPYFDHIYYRFGFSGTFMRNDSKTLDMFGFLSTVIYRYSASQAIEDGFLTPIQVVVHKINGFRGSNYQNEYNNNYCDNEDLRIKIKEIIQDNRKDQVLIRVGRKDRSGKILSGFLDELGFENDYVDGDCDKAQVKTALANFNAKVSRILIGSSILGEGIDIRATGHLVMAQGGKSEIAVTQDVGRLVRLFEGKDKGIIHEFLFQGTRYLEKHLERRLEIYQKNFGGEVVYAEN